MRMSLSIKHCLVSELQCVASFVCCQMSLLCVMSLSIKHFSLTFLLMHFKLLRTNNHLVHALDIVTTGFLLHLVCTILQAIYLWGVRYTHYEVKVRYCTFIITGVQFSLEMRVPGQVISTHPHRDVCVALQLLLPFTVLAPSCVCCVNMVDGAAVQLTVQLCILVQFCTLPLEVLHKLAIELRHPRLVHSTLQISLSHTHSM